MHASPINPSDIYYSKGIYGIKKQLPTTIGFEGCGTVVEIGQNSNNHHQQLLNKFVGCWASDDINSGTWAEYFITDVNNIIECDAQTEKQLQQQNQKKEFVFSCPFINPFTVLGFMDLAIKKQTHCVVFNGAGSQLVQMSIKYFKSKGFKTISIVRSDKSMENLIKIGSDYTINSENQNFTENLYEIFKIEKPLIFFDAVGGEQSGIIFDLMPRTAEMFVYGAFSQKLISKINPQNFIFQQKHMHGFWLSDWFKNQSQSSQENIKLSVKENLQSIFQSKIIAEYSIENIQQSLSNYEKNSKEGKTLLTFCDNQQPQPLNKDYKTNQEGKKISVANSDNMGAPPPKIQIKSLLRQELEKDNWPSVQQLNNEIQIYLSKAQSLTLKINSSEELKQMYSFLDLTSLNNTDTVNSIEQWLNKKLTNPYEQFDGLLPAAVCVYPQFSSIVNNYLKKFCVKTAVVATNFPTGQTFIDVKVHETQLAIKEGANEIDMVVNRGLWNQGTRDSEEACLDEIIQIKKVCGLNANLKVILENAELKDLATIYKLSYLALCAGSNFIKTSTGKSISSTGKVQGAELDQFSVMCLALRDFSVQKKDYSRGIKAAGGIKDILQAQKFITIPESILKTQLTSDRFRIGASSLADVILIDLAKITLPNQGN